MEPVLYKIGDIYGYKNKTCRGRDADNHIVLAADEYVVVCIPEMMLRHWLQTDSPYIETMVRRIPVTTFRLWYPSYLGNHTCGAGCVELATP